MRGRVMSLWFVAFQGSTPIGGPIVGAVMAVLGARAGLGLGAVTALVVGAAGLLALRRADEAQEPTGPTRQAVREHVMRDHSREDRRVRAPHVVSARGSGGRRRPLVDHIPSRRGS
jgi:MFS family permease